MLYYIIYSMEIPAEYTAEWRAGESTIMVCAISFKLIDSYNFIGINLTIISIFRNDISSWNKTKGK